METLEKKESVVLPEGKVSPQEEDTDYLHRIDRLVFDSGVNRYKLIYQALALAKKMQIEEERAGRKVPFEKLVYQAVEKIVTKEMEKKKTKE
jgi:hypothetical protein